MIKALEHAIEKAERLSEEHQGYATKAHDAYPLSDEERRLVREGTADLDAGRIVSDADMDAFWRRNRL
jgi:hypothetical protein